MITMTFAPDDDDDESNVAKVASVGVAWIYTCGC